MAAITSSLSGTSTVYVITDANKNTLTITAAAPGSGGAQTFVSSGALQPDGQLLLQTLITMISTGLRPNVQLNSNASFQN